MKLFSWSRAARVETKPITVIVTDDHSLYRQAVCRGLSKYRDIKVIGEAGNGQELLDKLETYVPDIVIMGVNMPVMDGITAMPIIRSIYPGLKVIILSMYNDRSVIGRMIELGANSYLTKDANSIEIYQVIKALEGNCFYKTTAIAAAFP
jgi:DNA-binding NarL/FixJ family response regulator